MYIGDRLVAQFGGYHLRDCSVHRELTRRLIRFFFLNDTATTEIYTLSLHDALPISTAAARCLLCFGTVRNEPPQLPLPPGIVAMSHLPLVCGAFSLMVSVIHAGQVT